MTKQAVIQNDDGDVKIVRGRFKNLELKDDLGDLKIKDVIFANSQIEMADGDIQARMLHLPVRMRFAAAW